MRCRARVIQALAVVMALAFCQSASRADIVVLTNPQDPARSVTAVASIDAAVDSDSVSFDQGGAFLNSALANVLSGGLALAEASQSSNIPNLTGPLMSGSGSATGSVLLTTGTSGQHAATSMLEVYFEVDAAATYLLGGSVSFSMFGPGTSGSGLISLYDVTNLTVLAEAEVNELSSGVAVLNSQILLQPGIVYLIKAIASANSDGVTGSAVAFSAASFSFELRRGSSTIIPEPASLTLGGVGVIFVLLPVARRRSRSRSAA